jgi:hypothetical protein
VVVGAGAFLSLLHTADTRYGEVVPDGEPQPVSVPAGERAMVMIPTPANRDSWTCRVTDALGEPVPTSAGGSVSFSNESAGWESLLTFETAASGRGREVTVHVACRTTDLNLEGDAGNVLVIKAPRVGAIVAWVALVVLGPVLLGGLALVWTVILVVLQVVRRTGA